MPGGDAVGPHAPAEGADKRFISQIPLPNEMLVRILNHDALNKADVGNAWAA